MDFIEDLEKRGAPDFDVLTICKEDDGYYREIRGYGWRRPELCTSGHYVRDQLKVYTGIVYRTATESERYDAVYTDPQTFETIKIVKTVL